MTTPLRWPPDFDAEATIDAPLPPELPKNIREPDAKHRAQLDVGPSQQFVNPIQQTGAMGLLDGAGELKPISAVGTRQRGSRAALGNREVHRAREDQQTPRMFFSPFYRMYIRARRSSRQHESRAGEPRTRVLLRACFHRLLELNLPCRNRTTQQYTRFVKPSELPPINDDDEHWISFREVRSGVGSGRKYWLGFSRRFKPVHGELPIWPESWWFCLADTIAEVRDFVILFVHVIVTFARLAKPGGLRSVIAESVLVRHRLLILSRSRNRSPNLRAADRIIAGVCTLFMRPTRILRSAISLRPSTLLRLHNLLKRRKYRLLFSRPCARRPGPKGPN